MNDFEALERLMLRVEQALCGKLNAQEAAELEAHLCECAACECEVAQVKQLRQLLQNSCGCEAPAELKERIRIQYQEIRIQIQES